MILLFVKRFRKVFENYSRFQFGIKRSLFCAAENKDRRERNHANHNKHIEHGERDVDSIVNLFFEIFLLFGFFHDFINHRLINFLFGLFFFAHPIIPFSNPKIRHA